MARRRMFSNEIVTTDAFLDMSLSAQALYFHLGMQADDDGLIGNPNSIKRMVGASEDDLKILIAKHFIIPFDSGVCGITHWRLNNTIQKDRYKKTVHQTEFGQLSVAENGMYTLCIQNVSTLDTQSSQVKSSLVKISQDKSSLVKGECIHVDNSVSVDNYMTYPQISKELNGKELKSLLDRYDKDALMKLLWKIQGHVDKGIKINNLYRYILGAAEREGVERNG